MAADGANSTVVYEESIQSDVRSMLVGTLAFAKALVEAQVSTKVLVDITFELSLHNLNSNEAQQRT